MTTSTPSRILPSSLAPRVMPKQRHEAPKRHPHDDKRRWRLAASKTPLETACEMILNPSAYTWQKMLPDDMIRASHEQINAIANEHSRALFELIMSYADWWHRSPATWNTIGQHLHALDRPVTIWSAAAAAGREAYSAAITCQRHAIADWRIVATDIDEQHIAAARAGHYDADEVHRFMPDAHDHFTDHCTSCRIRKQIRDRITFTVADIGCTTAPRCDVAIIADIWKTPGLTDEQQHHVLDQLDAQLADDGLLVLGPYDLIDWHSLNLQALEQGRQRGATFYSPPPLLLEHFEPLQPNSPLFQLLWRKRRDHTGRGQARGDSTGLLGRRDVTAQSDGGTYKRRFGVTARPASIRRRSS